jgi:putative transposase
MLYISAMYLAPQEIRTYLVTAVTAQRRRLFQVTANAELFRQTLFDYRDKKRFLLHAYVIMPDHFHALITPAPEVSLEKAMQFIKGGFSFRLKSRMDVWMKSFNESQISTTDKFVDCLRYIEENPVRARLVSSADAYPFSSAGHDGLDEMPAHFKGDFS